MIINYIYCGVQKCANGSKRIWGAVMWTDNSWTSTYIFWGSPEKPLVKKYIGHSKIPKSNRLKERIEKKKKGWSGYTEIKDDEIKRILPNIEAQIGMHILAKKLKSG